MEVDIGGKSKTVMCICSTTEKSSTGFIHPLPSLRLVCQDIFRGQTRAGINLTWSEPSWKEVHKWHDCPI